MSQDEALKRITKVVNSFLARPDSGPFREPVDWRGLELWDYPEVIEKMMDLGTVKRKLERGQYETAAACAADIRTVWSNCMTYNQEGSDFWFLAKNFSKRFEDRYRKIKAEFDVGEEDEETEEEEFDEDDDEEEDEEDDESNSDEHASEPNRSPLTTPESASAALAARSRTPPPPSTPLDAKAKFAANLFLLNGVELGHVVSLLELECPAAIENGTAVPEKMEIVFDKMDAATLQQLSQYAAEKAAHRKRGLTADAAAIHDVSNKRKRKR